MKNPLFIASTIFLILFVNTIYTHGQPQELDSLKSQLGTLEDDSIKVKLLLELGYYYEATEPDSAILIYNQIIQISSKIKYPLGEGKGYHYLGIVQSEQGNFGDAIVNYQKGIQSYQEANYKNGIAACYTNIGNVYNNQGIYDKSLEFYLKGIKIMEEIEDYNRLALSYTNIGTVYLTIEDYDRALEYQLKSFKLYSNQEDDIGLARAHINLGNTYLQQDEYDKAESHFLTSLEIGEYINEEFLLYFSFNNLATINRAKGEKNKAIDNILKALDYALITGSDQYISEATLSTGIIYADNLNFELAIKYIKESLYFNLENRLLKEIAISYDNLSKIEEVRGNYSEALDYYKLSNAYYDSLMDANTMKEIGRIEAKYNLENELDEQKRIQDKIENEEKLKCARNKRIQYSSILLFIVSLFILLLFIGNIKIPVNISKMVILISILLLFEFLLILFDPYIESISGNMPIYKLMLNSLLALVVIPLHQYLMNLFSRRLNI